MKVGIGLKSQSYTPEAYAYEAYLKKKCVEVQLELEDDICPNNDINIFFMGFQPLWQKNPGRAKIIHEYQSLSTAPYAKLKDSVKRFINKKPSGRIFLNEIVRQELNFSDDIPYINRDMGVDSSLYQRPVKDAEFDIVYAGSIEGRIGLIFEIIRLSNLGFRFLLIGDVSAENRAVLSTYSNILLVGRVSRNELPNLYRKCKAGLNYTPDLYPFNIQTSTKTLEYLASGLLVISNRYKWSSDFFHDKQSSVIWLDDFSGKDTLYYHFEKYQAPDMSEFSWDRILNKSNFIGFLTASLR